MAARRWTWMIGGAVLLMGSAACCVGAMDDKSRLAMSVGAGENTVYDVGACLLNKRFVEAKAATIGMEEELMRWRI